MVDQYVIVAPDSTGKKIDTAELTVNAQTVERQRLVIGDNTAPAAFATVDPMGELWVRDEPRQLFYDPYDAALDTTNRWVAPTSSGGGVGAAVSAGNLTLGTGTTTAGYSYLMSVATFPSTTPGWIRFAFNVLLEYPITAQTYRFWGGAKPQAVPTTGNPISDGCGFEVSTGGTMYAVVYQGASRTAVATLTTVVDTATHNYQVFYRPTNIYWLIDGVVVATGTLTQSVLNVDAVPISYIAVAGTSPGSSGVITSNACSVSDTAKNASQISDGTFPWRKAKVDASGNLMVLDTDLTAAGNITVVNSNLATGAATAWSTVAVPQLNDDGSAAIQVTGVWTGTLIGQVSVDGSNWVTLGALINVNTGSSTATIASAAVGIWQAEVSGFKSFRVTASAAMTGTAVVSVQISGNTGMVALDASLPAGTAVIGALSANQSVNVAQVASGNLSTSATGVQRVGIAGNANATLDAAVGSLPTNNLAAIQVPTTGSGASLSCRTLSAMSTATNVKGSGPGNLYGFALVNGSTSAGFVSFFNTSSTTTTAPVLSYPIGASATVYVPPGALAILNCATGIGIYCSTTVGGTTTITPINGSVFYA